jgi:4-hydroxy-tetrahydrodipicolinate synthase
MMHTGLHVPLITPFAADGEVDLPSLTALAADVLDAGAAGLVALGTTGEPSCLTPAERHQVVAALTVGTTDPGSLPAGAAALVTVPPFLRPGEEGVLAWFAALAASATAPIVAYHVPYRTAQPLSADGLRRLAAIPGVTAMKLATGGLDTATVALLADPPPGFAVLAGDDAFLPALLALGAHGGVTASAQVAPGAFAALTGAWLAPSPAAGPARRAGARITPLALALFAEPNPTVIKGVLHAQGRIPTAAVRLPLVAASPQAVQAALAVVP